MPNDGNLLSKSLYSGNALVKVGDGTLIHVAHIGTSSIPSIQCPFNLKNVLHVPKL